MMLSAELRQELQDTFEYADVDDMHLDEAARRFLEDYTQTLSLQEVLEFIRADLSKWLEVPEKLLSVLNLHHRIDVKLGEVLHATQYHLVKPELELACSPSIGVRVVTALATTNADILQLTAVDPCYLVRLATYENKKTPKGLVEKLKPEDPYLREYTAQEIESLGDDFEEIATVEQCGCAEDDITDLIHDKYDKRLLNVPPIANQFETRIRYFGGLSFGTQPLPSPIEDYLFRDILNYLSGPIPDHYVVNHAGHGINSYSLNFRYALGDLAILAQVPYGGGYGNKESDSKRWNECVERVGDIMILNPENRKEGIWRRKYLLLYSNFRGENEIQLIAFRNNAWSEVPLVKSWDDVYEFFSFWGRIEDLISN